MSRKSRKQKARVKAQHEMYAEEIANDPNIEAIARHHGESNRLRDIFAEISNKKQEPALCDFALAMTRDP